MTFHDIRFPPAISFGATGGPERRTEIVTLASGHEERNSPWAHPRRRYDAGTGLRTLDQLAEVVAFFEARRGPLHGFRWKDWADHLSCRPSASPGPQDQLLGLGDELQLTFQLVKIYGSGDQSYLRPIEKPVAGTVQVAVGGIPQIAGQDYEVDAATGRVTFAHPPDVGAEVTAGFEFDVPVRFDTEALTVSAATFDAGEVPQIPVVEVRP